MRALLLLASLLIAGCAPEADDASGAAPDPASTRVADVTSAPPVPRDVPEDQPTAEELARSVVAPAPTYAEPFLAIDDAWAPPPPGGTEQAAIYLTITNTGLGPDLFVAAETPIAGRAMLHGHVLDGDHARMEQRSEIEIPANGAVSLEPGGDHIMLTELTGPLREGETFPLTLTFERAGSVEVTVHVESLASRLRGEAEGEDRGRQ